ncbi:PilZ domain-containing protein [Vogesella oryzae]|uniref:PilZ domain-containing protein n=1 Tax=Vogesella oryzae TaxID=1735285 RepID=UPI0015825E7A|nr:PilZ domain-containing protein [Vogesella oryzae]
MSDVDSAVPAGVLSAANDNRPQRIDDRAEIAALLAMLQQDMAALYLYPPDSDRAFEGTRLLPTDGQQLQLLLPPGAPLPLPWQASGWRMVLIAAGCIVQCELPALELQDECLCCALPLQLSRWQRRAFLRLDAPLGRNFSASFTLLGEQYQANVYDLSLGGIGLYASPWQLPQLLPGRQLSKVRIELGAGRVMQAELEVRLCRSFRSRLLGEQLHVGCRIRALGERDAALLRQCLAELAAVQLPPA